MQFKNRDEVIQALVARGEKAASFNNTATNSSVERFWTFNRLLTYYIKRYGKTLRFAKRTAGTKLF
jgi:predicted component of viral defense system (DUF524 family)